LARDDCESSADDSREAQIPKGDLSWATMCASMGTDGVRWRLSFDNSVRLFRIALGMTAGGLFACSSSSPAGPADATSDDAADDGGDAGDDSGDGGADADAGPKCGSSNATGSPGTFHKAPRVNKVARTYTLVVPNSTIGVMDAGCGVPLVIGLHGAGDTADNFLAYVGLGATGINHKFIVAAPDALNGVWFEQTSEGWNQQDGNPSSMQNDIALVQTIIADTGAAYRIDLSRVYVCGWSRGGGFTGLLAASSNNPSMMDGGYTSPFAAYGITAGYNALETHVPAVDLAKSSPKRPLWIIHGTADMNVPFTDGQTFAYELMDAGWPVKFTPVQGAPHDWLWQTQYGYTNNDLWTFFAANPAQ